MFKFCQTYDENLDTYVGGFSICDALSCILTCGLIYRQQHQEDGASANELDFRKRFERSMEKARGDGNFSEKKKRERLGKSVANYLSQNAKEKGIYGAGNGDDDPFSGQDGQKRRSKCHEFCCIVFCCIDANVYYGEESYQKIGSKGAENAENESGPAGQGAKD